jgi:hypothetical protein
MEFLTLEVDGSLAWAYVWRRQAAAAAERRGGLE